MLKLHVTSAKPFPPFRKVVILLLKSTLDNASM